MDDQPLPAASPPTLDQLGESGVLARILPLLPAGPHTLLGPGDDAAVVAASDGRVVVSTDVLVEGRDFRREWSTSEDVGWKAAMQNLADVAAMGAVPTALVVALAAPVDLPVAWAEGLARGLAAACRRAGAGVVGGDLSSSSEIMVSVTVLGDLQGRTPVRRDGARPGDVVAVAGALGRSAAGWALLEAGRTTVAPDVVDVHRRPRSPLAAGPAAADAGATAMIDVSDGLLLDLGRVADASGVTINLMHQILQELVEPLLEAAGGDRDVALGWLLTGGEDHAMAACFPADVPLPAGFVRVGEVQRRLVGWPSVLEEGDPPPVAGVGWDHFASGMLAP